MAGTHTTRGKVADHPPPVAITLLLVAEHGLVGVAEGEVEGLGREVTEDVGRVTTPQREDALVFGGTAEALHDTLVPAVETTRLDHLILSRACGLASFHRIAHLNAKVLASFKPGGAEMRELPLGAPRT